MQQALGGREGENLKLDESSFENPKFEIRNRYRLIGMRGIDETWGNFEIGQILHFKSEIRDLKSEIGID
jgi:hypothetical protein